MPLKVHDDLIFEVARRRLDASDASLFETRTNYILYECKPLIQMFTPR
jgi:DNA polymerase I-like protein with 3'-5' exonuclease and polymerase domains